MKVFYINPMSYGNSALYDYNLLKNIDKTDVDIVFWGSNLYDSDEINKAIFRPVFSYNKLKNKYHKAISYVISLLKITVSIIAERPDIIHIQWIRLPKVDLLFAKIFKLLNCKIVYTAHNVLPHNDNRKSFLQYKKYYSSVDKIITHARESKEELSKQFNIAKEKIIVIQHGLISIKHNRFRVNSLMQKLTIQNCLKDKIVFSSLGSQSPYKGIQNLIELWTKNDDLSQNPKIHLILAGKFVDINYSLIKIFPNVTIMDKRIDDDEYIAISRISNVIILPYINISQSGVLLSALNERIPVLVSHKGGLYEPLEIADVGWDIGSPNIENLLNRIREIINNPENIRYKKNNLQEWDKIHRSYSWKNISNRTLEFYLSLV